MELEKDKEHLEKKYPEGYSLCCVVYKKWYRFKVCLQSWLCVNYDLPFEINIVVNGPNEDIYNFLENLSNERNNIKVFYFDHNLGAAQGLNVAFSSSKYRYIIKIDDDILFPYRSEWPSRFRRFSVENLDVGVISGVALSSFPSKEYVVDNHPVLKEESYMNKIFLKWRMYNCMFVQEYNNLLSKTIDEDGRYFFKNNNDFIKFDCFLQGCFIFFNRSIFEKIGFLSENFGKHGHDDIDFDNRIRGVGFRNAYDTASYYLHWVS